MDEQLQQIFKLRPLQTNCIAYRSSTDDYRKIMKQTCVSELKNLVNVDMKIEQVQLKMPDENQIPRTSEEIKKSKADELLNEISVVEDGLMLL
ncbi:uncharacterized protein LOC111689987 [Lucilia cuprina]|uniref:uncharacterized protein LOC111689987 n=1 Tax=Lucilia cuprina TaxID=7375 RepID=UPI001F06BC54|nr:uncharacterized protein LOC111689987 [Lucilia cuprina]